MFPLSLHNYFEILALGFSLLFWKNISSTNLRWFVPYLIFIVFAELAGRYYSRELKQSNGWIYNISVPIEYSFLVFIFLSNYKRRIYRIVARAFLILFSTYVVVCLLINGITVFNTNILSIGSFFMMIFSILFLIELYNRPGFIHLSREPVFWVAVGVLLFNAGEFSYDLLSKFLLTERLDKERAIFRSINKYLNMLLYLCISISFIWKKDTAT